MRLIFIVIMILLGTTANSEGLFSWLFNSGKEITAEIKLVNKCQLDSKYFIVRDLESGKSAPFTNGCLLYTSPSPRDAHESRMPSSA